MPAKSASLDPETHLVVEAGFVGGLAAGDERFLDVSDPAIEDVAERAASYHRCAWV